MGEKKPVKMAEVSASALNGHDNEEFEAHPEAVSTVAAIRSNVHVQHLTHT